jgi:hypothetical protein
VFRFTYQYLRLFVEQGDVTTIGKVNTREYIDLIDERDSIGVVVCCASPDSRTKRHRCGVLHSHVFHLLINKLLLACCLHTFWPCISAESSLSSDSRQDHPEPSLPSVAGTLI